MTKLVIVRHGQTEWNRVERFRGRVDLELTEVGLRQAQAVAERLARWTVQHVYASPLKRAWHTSQAIARPLGLEVIPLEAITDVDYGGWQGLSPQEAAQRYPELYNLWLNQPQQLRFPSGEALAEVQERSLAATKEVLSHHPDQTIVLVTHRVICKLLVLGLMGLDTSHFWKVDQDVGGLSLFEFRSGQAIAVLVNDTCHLKDL